MFETNVSPGFYLFLRSLSNVSRLSVPIGLYSICYTLSVLYAKACLTVELFLEVFPPLDRYCAEPNVSGPSAVKDFPA